MRASHVHNLLWTIESLANYLRLTPMTAKHDPKEKRQEYNKAFIENQPTRETIKMYASTNYSEATLAALKL